MTSTPWLEPDVVCGLAAEWDARAVDEKDRVVFLEADEELIEHRVRMGLDAVEAAGLDRAHGETGYIAVLYHHAAYGPFALAGVAVLHGVFI